MKDQRSPYCNCLLFSVNALSRKLGKMADEDFAGTGLSYSHALLLLEVNEHPGIQPGVLSATMRLTPSTMTRLIEKLEHMKYLRRETSGKNTLVYPTAKSKELHPRILEAWQHFFGRYKEAIGDALALDLTESSNQAYEKMNQHSQD